MSFLRFFETSGREDENRRVAVSALQEATEWRHLSAFVKTVSSSAKFCISQCQLSTKYNYNVFIIAEVTIFDW